MIKVQRLEKKNYTCVLHLKIMDTFACILYILLNCYAHIYCMRNGKIYMNIKQNSILSESKDYKSLWDNLDLGQTHTIWLSVNTRARDVSDHSQLNTYILLSVHTYQYTFLYIYIQNDIVFTTRIHAHE